LPGASVAAALAELRLAGWLGDRRAVAETVTADAIHAF
jgi:hypothetical protein